MLLPLLAEAQQPVPAAAGPDSYVLSDSRTVRHAGELRLASHAKLVVHTPDGQRLTFTPEQVVSFRIGSRRYITVDNLEVRAGLSSFSIDHAFVEQLDSGQVQLMQLDFRFDSPTFMASSAGGFGGGPTGSAYVLRSGQYGSAVAVQGGGPSGEGGGKRFREALRPFLQSRPDMVKLLDEKRIAPSNLV